MCSNNFWLAVSGQTNRNNSSILRGKLFLMLLFKMQIINKNSTKDGNLHIERVTSTVTQPLCLDRVVIKPCRFTGCISPWLQGEYIVFLCVSWSSFTQGNTWAKFSPLGCDGPSSWSAGKSWRTYRLITKGFAILYYSTGGLSFLFWKRSIGIQNEHKVSAKFSGFLPQLRDMHVELIGDFSWCGWEWFSVSMQLTGDLSRVYPRLLLIDHGDKHQIWCTDSYSYDPRTKSVFNQFFFVWALLPHSMAIIKWLIYGITGRPTS